MIRMTVPTIILILLVFCAGMALGGLILHSRILQFDSYTVYIQGTLPLDNDVHSIIDRYRERWLPALPVEAISNEIKKLPSVASVSISRSLHAPLAIRIQTRNPVARIRTPGFNLVIDAHGVAFGDYGLQSGKLPVFSLPASCRIQDVLCPDTVMKAVLSALAYAAESDHPLVRSMQWIAVPDRFTVRLGGSAGSASILLSPFRIEQSLKLLDRYLNTARTMDSGELDLRFDGYIFHRHLTEGSRHG